MSQPPGIPASSELSPHLFEYLGFTLTKVQERFKAVSNVRLAPFGIEVMHLSLLGVLALEGPHTQIELARKSGRDRSSMVGMVDQLENLKLLERQPNPQDRRANILRITPEGEWVVHQGKTLLEQAQSKFLAVLPESDRACFLNSLQTLVLEHF